MDNCKFIRGINKVDLKKIVASAGFKTENYTTEEDFVDHYVHIGLKNTYNNDVVVLEISEGRSDTDVYTVNLINLNDNGLVVDKQNNSVGETQVKNGWGKMSSCHQHLIYSNDEQMKKLDLSIKEYVKYAESEEKANI